jgi:hypothetical protein
MLFQLTAEAGHTSLLKKNEVWGLWQYFQKELK